MKLPSSAFFLKPLNASRGVLGRLPVVHARAWYALSLCLALFCVVATGSGWWSAKQETQDAFELGRRLLISIENNQIAGNMVRTVAPVEEDQAAKDAAPAPAPPEAPAPQDNPADAQAAPGVVMVDLSDQKLPAVPPSRMMADSNSGLQEKTKDGIAPTVGANGAKPWKYYAKPFDGSDSKPMIAIIVTGLGQNKLVTDNALRLPENITLSFSGYAPDIASWAKSARATGHEILLDLPLEPSDYPATDPGPNGMLVDKGVSANEENMQWLVTRVPVYVGVLAPQSENYSRHAESFRAMLQSISNHGLMLVMGRDPAKNDTKETLTTSNTAHVISDMTIDEELSATIIKAHLTQLEQLAKKHGRAVALAQPYPLTIQQLRDWSATLEEKGIMLVPVTAVAKLKFS